MQIAFFDCSAGASGDMIVGSLIDAGLEIDYLIKKIEKINLSGYKINAKKVLKKGISGTKLYVHIDKDHVHHRNISDIKNIILKSTLSDTVKENSLRIFYRLAEAESKIHQKSIDEIHFHEIGAIDSIIDIVAACIGIEELGIEKIYCSPFNVGSGILKCEHGLLPVPAPATIELLKGKPIYSKGIFGEILTPTGAAILATLSSGFGEMPSMNLKAIGYGAGEKDFDVPNLLRLIIGETTLNKNDYLSDVVGVIETNIDDMNPQIYDYLFHKVFEIGALDIFLSSLYMKKNRPGTLVTIICNPDIIKNVADLLLKETATLGLRWRLENRIKLKRHIKEIDTKFGKINIKIAEINGKILKAQPEYDDIKRISIKENIPMYELIEYIKKINLF
ncbi:MAG: nickel pincer cofactor biosynthesis protein LarC [Desulfobacterales bacterium]|nr:nickel pincer cofactor biosynthesis protein LarC [Desulfobacterales bacterium]